MVICDVNKCTGCGACANVCPRHAIKMLQDSEGFIRPFISDDICIYCNRCVNTCPSNKKVAINNVELNAKAYSYIHPDLDTLKRSSSGGIFFTLAEYVLSQGGCVFGAVYDDNFSVVLKKAETENDLLKMHSSKYVECNTVNSYAQVKEALISKRMALFTGLPCHIDGLYSILEDVDCSTLYTMELLCHGVPSSGLFHSYIDYLSSKNGEILEYTFRDKSKWGWGNWGSFVYKKNGRTKRKHFVVASDYYYALFFKETCFRESCYNCKYASLPRLSDITVGDYWGIEKKMPSKKISNGVSVVIANNQRGENLLLLSTNSTCLETVDLSSVLVMNITVTNGTKRPASRDTFYTSFAELGFESTAMKYVKLKKVVPILARYIPRGLKNMAHKLIKKARE